MAQDEADIIRYAALLRGTESAWQAVSYGLESIKIFAEVGGVYMNFALWAISIIPAWLVLRHFGAGEDRSASDGSLEAETTGPEGLKSGKESE